MSGYEMATKMIYNNIWYYAILPPHCNKMGHNQCADILHWPIKTSKLNAH